LYESVVRVVAVADAGCPREFLPEDVLAGGEIVGGAGLM